jgi:TRAP transporter 4TM/12TM fusion protein
MAYVITPVQVPERHLETHLFFALIVCLLSFSASTEKKQWRSVFFVCAVLTVITTGYLYIYYETVILHFFFNPPYELILGVVLLVIAIIATWRAWGAFIPLIVIGAVLYPFFGSHMPGPLHTSSYSLSRVIANLGLSFTSGLHSSLLSISANFLFLFIVFGSLLQGLGATTFFIELGRLFGGKLKGGPAMMAVISSAGVGSISGSVAANISITGAFTIPMMKSVGYSPSQAAGIETASSNGGQILPPVMGVAAFFMAGLTGIPYIKICVMALIPALLYYLNIGTYVYLQAAKQRIGTVTEAADKRELLLSAPMVIIPFGIIVYLLIKGYSVIFTAFWAIISVTIVTLIRKNTRPSLRGYIDGFVDGAMRGAEIGVMLASLGILLTTINMTGLGLKIGAGVSIWSGGNILVAMVIVWALSVVLGMVGVVLVAYMILSMFVAASMEKVGIPFEIAHFFIFFPAVFAGLTPPIAIFAMVGAKIAKASYMETAIESIKMGGLGLLLPFMFVFNPVLLLQLSGPVETVTTILIAIIMIISSQIAFSGYLMINCSLGIRLLFTLVSIASLIFLVSLIYTLFIAIIFLFTTLVLYQRHHSKLATRYIEVNKPSDPILSKIE